MKRNESFWTAMVLAAIACAGSAAGAETLVVDTVTLAQSTSPSKATDSARTPAAADRETHHSDTKGDASHNAAMDVDDEKEMAKQMQSMGKRMQEHGMQMEEMGKQMRDRGMRMNKQGMNMEKSGAPKGMNMHDMHTHMQMMNKQMSETDQDMDQMNSSMEDMDEDMGEM